MLLIITLRLLEVLGFGWFADPIAAVQPTAQVHQLAALTAKGAVRRVLLTDRGEAFMTGWTFERRHGFLRKSVRATS